MDVVNKMAHVRNQCIECLTELALDDYTCPDDESHDVEEIYDMKCNKCEWEGEQGCTDVCPDCGGQCEESEYY